MKTMKKLPKDFCEWLFGIMDIPFARQMDWKLKHQRSPNEREYKNVNRYTRAGKGGKFVMCPHCHADTRVYHFSWANMTCNNCMASVDKNDWLEIDWKY
jgi:ribosomal protein S27E